MQVYLIGHEIGHAISHNLIGGANLDDYYLPIRGYGGGISLWQTVWSQYGLNGENEIWAEAFGARIYYQYTGNHISSEPQINQMQPLNH